MSRATREMPQGPSCLPQSPSQGAPPAHGTPCQRLCWPSPTFVGASRTCMALKAANLVSHTPVGSPQIKSPLSSGQSLRVLTLIMILVHSMSFLFSSSCSPCPPPLSRPTPPGHRCRAIFASPPTPRTSPASRPLLPRHSSPSPPPRCPSASFQPTHAPLKSALPEISLQEPGSVLILLARVPSLGVGAAAVAPRAFRAEEREEDGELVPHSSSTMARTTPTWTAIQRLQMVWAAVAAVDVDDVVAVGSDDSIYTSESSMVRTGWGRGASGLPTEIWHSHVEAPEQPRVFKGSLVGAPWFVSR